MRWLVAVVVSWQRCFSLVAGYWDVREIIVRVPMSDVPSVTNGMIKADGVRRMIELLVPPHHRGRVNDLLTALEQDIGYGTLHYAVALIDMCLANDQTMYGDVSVAMQVDRAEQRLRRAINHATWQRDDIVPHLSRIDAVTLLNREAHE